MKKINKNNIKKTQDTIYKGLSEKIREFIKRTNKFLKDNNIKPKEFAYQTGLSFRQ